MTTFAVFCARQKARIKARRSFRLRAGRTDATLVNQGVRQFEKVEDEGPDDLYDGPACLDQDLEMEVRGFIGVNRQTVPYTRRAFSASWTSGGRVPPHRRAI